MLIFLDLFVLSFIGTIVVRTLFSAINTRSIRSADLICASLFFFYGLPLAYDRLISAVPPNWFYSSWANDSVRLRYDLVLLAAIVLIKIGAYRRVPVQVPSGWHGGFSLRPLRPIGVVPLFVSLSWILLLLPLPSIFLLSSNPLSYFSYGSVVQRRSEVGGFELVSIGMISTICLLALLGFFIIYWVRMRMTRSAADMTSLFAMFWAFVAVWIHGKRSAVAFLVLILMFVNFFERRLRLGAVIGFVIATLIGGYLYIGIAKGYERSPLEYVRGDLCRDYTLRHAIYQSGWTKSNIVPYRGAGYLFVATAWVPRAVWPSKPWPSPVYFTNNVFARSDNDYLGWGFGIGFLEELIMNFGLIGVGGCLFIGWLSGWLDRFIYSRSSYYAVLWLPMIFGTVFASSVILKVVLFMVIPAMVLSRVFAGRNSWAEYGPVAYSSQWGQQMIHYQ